MCVLRESHDRDIVRMAIAVLRSVAFVHGARRAITSESGFVMERLAEVILRCEDRRIQANAGVLLESLTCPVVQQGSQTQAGKGEGGREGGAAGGGGVLGAVDGVAVETGELFLKFVEIGMKADGCGGILAGRGGAGGLHTSSSVWSTGAPDDGEPIEGLAAVLFLASVFEGVDPAEVQCRR